MQTEQNPLILTLRLDTNSQAYFDHLRRQHFPPERNFLNAHLTLFHQLPNRPSTLQHLTELKFPRFEMAVCGLRHLGAGVAYQISSLQLQQLHKTLSQHFHADLIPQDRQPFHPHITVQNKVSPQAAKQLLAGLSKDFEPFIINATGMDLWEYMGGPWRHCFSCDFENNDL